MLKPEWIAVPHAALEAQRDKIMCKVNVMATIFCAVGKMGGPGSLGKQERRR